MTQNDRPTRAKLVEAICNTVRFPHIPERLVAALEEHFVVRPPEAPSVRCGSCMDDMSNRCEDCRRTVFCGICKTYDIVECGEYEEHRAHAAASTATTICRCMHPMHEGKACGHTWSPKLPAMPRCQCPGNDDWESRQSGPPVWIPIKAWGASHIAMASATKEVAEARAKTTTDGAVPSLWVHASALTAAVRTASRFAALAEQLSRELDEAHSRAPRTANEQHVPSAVASLLDFLESHKATLHGTIHQMTELNALVARARLALAALADERAPSTDDIYLLRYSDDQTLYQDHVFTSRENAQDYAETANESGNFRPGITLTVEGPYRALPSTFIEGEPEHIVINAQWHDVKSRLDKVDGLLRAIIVFSKKPSELFDAASMARFIIAAPPADGQHWVNLLEETEQKRAALVVKLAESESARTSLRAEAKKLSEQQAQSDRCAADAQKQTSALTEIFMRANGGNDDRPLTTLASSIVAERDDATRRLLALQSVLRPKLAEATKLYARIDDVGISPADAVHVKTLLNSLAGVIAMAESPKPEEPPPPKCKNCGTPLREGRCPNATPLTIDEAPSGEWACGDEVLEPGVEPDMSTDSEWVLVRFTKGVWPVVAGMSVDGSTENPATEAKGEVYYVPRAALEAERALVRDTRAEVLVQATRALDAENRLADALDANAKGGRRVPIPRGWNVYDTVNGEWWPRNSEEPEHMARERAVILNAKQPNPARYEARRVEGKGAPAAAAKCSACPHPSHEGRWCAVMQGSLPCECGIRHTKTRSSGASDYVCNRGTTGCVYGDRHPRCYVGENPKEPEAAVEPSLATPPITADMLRTVLEGLVAEVAGHCGAPYDATGPGPFAKEGERPCGRPARWGVLSAFTCDKHRSKDQPNEIGGPALRNAFAMLATPTTPSTPFDELARRYSDLWTKYNHLEAGFRSWHEHGKTQYETRWETELKRVEEMAQAVFDTLGKHASDECELCTTVSQHDAHCKLLALAHAALPLWAIWRRPRPLPPNGGETERYPRDYKPTNQATAESVAKTMNESEAWPAWAFEARPEAKG